ncbi:hypothetical protein [Archangium lansingense]|uniref:Lipoprotein n=1 Tax=Archangium lansingense TaxID=2995310 RepID=A0ABT4ANK8_9BACT|nr:hypothetical protein [Archangium lansinium]MCY1082402.1 hypothetical protein [Archangium lansinium]
MMLRHGLFTLALSAMFLAPVAARADDSWGRHDASPVGQASHGGQHIHTGGCYHPAPTPPPAQPPRSNWPRQSGRYELQTVREFVPGRYEQVWVEQNCRYRPRRNVTKCEGGHYEQRWVAGYYQSVQEWVWVPVHRGPYGRG